MRRNRKEAVQLGEVLNVLAGRLRKVDLRVIDQLRELWPTIIDEVVAKECRPEFIKGETLVVSVPSGAYAERIRRDEKHIIEALAVLGKSAPVHIRTILNH
jgi:hypothetical protein